MQETYALCLHCIHDDSDATLQRHCSGWGSSDWLNGKRLTLTFLFSRESVSIPKNPRTDRPVGYAFVDLSTPTEAERAIAELSGKDILERKVSVQLARTPQPAGEKAEGAANGDSGAEGTRRRASGRGRGRGRGRAGRAGRGGRSVSS